MAYSSFTLDTLIEAFDLTVQEKSGLFADVPAVEGSSTLTQSLAETVELAIAINTEKARSELIIAPILLEIKRRHSQEISLFSGVEFNVDAELGLVGTCDFLISKSPEQLYVRSPVITVVEAKNENLKSGFAQCIAEMVAAQLFNQKKQNSAVTVLGVITIGTIWRFLRLVDRTLEIDLSEYYIKDLDTVLGILEWAVISNS